jgi:hypothetical protein
VNIVVSKCAFKLNSYRYGTVEEFVVHSRDEFVSSLDIGLVRKDTKSVHTCRSRRRS